MDANIITWADGYGRWHVTLPVSETCVTDAVFAITTAIRSRGNGEVPFEDTYDYVCEHMVELPSDTEGRVHFAEYNI